MHEILPPKTLADRKRINKVCDNSKDEKAQTKLIKPNFTVEFNLHNVETSLMDTSSVTIGLHI